MLFIVGIFAATCADTRVRKEIRDMSSAEWTSYKNAIRAMQKDGSYQDFASKHVQIFSQIHGNYIFAQWHRVYLCKFEDLVRAHSPDNPNIGVPYYAAWEDSGKYGPNTVDRSPVFSDQYFGAGSGTGQCINASPNSIFESSSTTVGGNHCIVRNFDHSRGISGRASIQNLATGTANFMQFSDLLQVGYHAETHLFVSGDMAQHWSVNDPIFFSHHASVDYVYEQFQESKNDYNPNTVSDNQQKVKLFEQYTYGDAHANNVCCGDYQAYSGSNGLPLSQPPATNTTKPSNNSNNGTVVQNKPASAADLAKLGIPASKASKQTDWNNFKTAFANGNGSSFVSDLLKNNQAGPVKPKTGSSAQISCMAFVIAAIVISC
eukprot:NODE_343_length_10566_cov_0.542371.p2 type:complete len:376 gc:universal NODE_343_length_10566_cov_0.542371:3872-4999(+)